MTKPFDELLVEGLIFMFLVCAGWKVLEWLYGCYHKWRYDVPPNPPQIYPWDDPVTRAWKEKEHERYKRELQILHDRKFGGSAKQPITKDVQEPDVLRRTTKEFSGRFQGQQLAIAQAERLERVRENQRINSDIAKIERLEAKLAIEQAELDRAAKATRSEK